MTSGSQCRPSAAAGPAVGVHGAKEALKDALAAVHGEQNTDVPDAGAFIAALTRKLTTPPPKRPREAYRAQKGGLFPRGIFMHIVGYWRSSRDYFGPTPGPVLQVEGTPKAR